jgi:hypothetical protein
MLPLSHNAQEYIRAELLRRAGIGTTDGGVRTDPVLNPRIQYADPDRVKEGEADVIVVPCSSDAVHRLLDLSPGSLDWMPASSVLPPECARQLIGPVPILLWGDRRDVRRTPVVERRRDGCLVFNADIFAGSLFMLSRWEESIGKVRDEHDRFPASASVAFQQGFLDRPVVDEYGQLLGEWLRTLFPRWQGLPNGFSVQLSHDIDAVRQASTPRAGIRKASDLLFKEGRPWGAARSLGRIVGLGKDPYTTGIFFLASLSREYRFSSVFNFMTAASSPWDDGYDIRDPFVRGIIQQLTDGGFEIGFHPSYFTVEDPILLAREKEEFDAVIGWSNYGGRQHYLRFNVPETWRSWEQWGLAYDSTLGYADHEGFRAGTCWRFRPFDVQLDRPLELWEIPLIVMDATLFRHRALTPEQGKERILELARRSMSVGGTFTLLWHNSSFINSWEPWGKMYREALSNLTGAALGKRGDLPDFGKLIQGGLKE